MRGGLGLSIKVSLFSLLCVTTLMGSYRMLNLDDRLGVRNCRYVTI